MPAMSNTRPRRGQSHALRTVGRFFRWWGRELSALVPARLRPKDRPPANLLWLGQDSTDLVIWNLAEGKLQEIARLAHVDTDVDSLRIAFEALWNRYGRKPIGLCLQPAQVLRKSLELPLAARDNLAQVLSFELGRRTPFMANQAYFDHQIEQEDLVAGRLQVSLTIAPRAEVDKLLNLPRLWGVPVRCVAVTDELLGAGSYANLLPVSLRPRQHAFWPWLYAAMAVLTLLMLVAMAAIPVWQKRELALALMNREDTAAREAAKVDALRDMVNQKLALYNFTLEQKLTKPTTVAILEEVSRLLPDDTWLQQLEIHDNKVLMDGNSASPARLISLLEKSRLLGGANFTSQLVKGRGGEERFQLEATLKPIPLKEAIAAQKASLGEGKTPAKANKKPTGTDSHHSGATSPAKPSSIPSTAPAPSPK